LATQARLLRVLETGEYISVGSSEVRKTNIRIVAATNVNMEKAIAEGKFREDLYYRLNSISINVPPLRERGNDVVLLFKKFALEMSEKYKMPAIRLNEDANQMLVAYSWPGNVRQLKNIAENMSVTAEEREITADILRRYLPEVKRHDQLVMVKETASAHSFENEREILYKILFDLRRDVSELKKIVHESGLHQQAASVSSTENPAVTLYRSHHSLGMDKEEETDDSPIWEAEEIEDNNEQGTAPSLEEVEKDMISKALLHNHGRRKAAAVQLGISERTLYRKIKEYGLE
jgi:DNA-binding NtrC family response regulator